MRKATWYLNNLAENLELEQFTMHPQYQLMEVSRLIKDDPKGRLLLDDFLEACFDSVQFPEFQPITDLRPQTPDPVEQLSVTLHALNTHLTQQALLPEGIMPPSHLELNEWAEDITMNILTNRPF